MNSDELCLAIDLGTGGPKVGLVSLDGAVLAYEVHHVLTRYGGDGSATQDAEEWWRLIVEATRRLVGASGRAEDVRAVAVTGQYASTVPVDETGRPVGECLTWLDTRGVVHNRRALGGPVQGYHPWKVARFLRKSGGAPSMASGDPLGQILFLQRDCPEVDARARWYLEPVDYLTTRLTGSATATLASRFTLWMTDNRRLDQLRYDRELLGLAGLSDERLAPLVPVGSVVGTLTPSVAKELCLSSAVQVITGVPDLHAAALGAGATAPYAAHLALSTSSWISCPVPKKKTDALHSIAAVPGLSADSYLIIDNQETGAKALEWCRDALSDPDAPTDYEALTALAATSPSGAKGVRFLPWLAGERSPVDDKRARGAFVGLSITSTRADLVRAVMEGVAANSRWLFEYVERFAGRELDPVRVLGGGAQSRLWCQIYADALNREVEQVPTPMVAQMRGAALLASVSLGRRGLDDVDAVVPRGERFVPDPVERLSARRRSEDLRESFRRERRLRARRRSPK